jgi:hypothetical protein
MEERQLYRMQQKHLDDDNDDDDDDDDDDELRDHLALKNPRQYYLMHQKHSDACTIDVLNQQMFVVGGKILCV